MDQTVGTNPTNNNPRLDLLHNSGDNQQLKGAAGTYTGDTSSRAQVVHASAPASAAPMPPRPIAVPATAPAAVPAAAAPEPRPVAGPQVVKPTGDGPKKANILARAGIVVIVLVLLAAAGVGGWWYLTQQNEVPAETTSKPKPKAAAIVPAEVSELSQEAEGVAIESGKAVTSNDIVFKFTLPTSATSGTISPEIELRPATDAFTGEPTTIGQAVDANGKNLELSIQVNDLVDGNYHWQVRAVSADKQGDWVVFGDDPSKSTLVISSAVAATPAPPAATPTPTPAATPPPPAATPPPPPTPTPAPEPAPAPTPQPTLAATGDATLPISLTSTALMILAAGGWIWTRGRHAKG